MSGTIFFAELGVRMTMSKITNFLILFQIYDLLNEYLALKKKKASLVAQLVSRVAGLAYDRAMEESITITTSK